MGQVLSPYPISEVRKQAQLGKVAQLVSDRAETPTYS
jgi:hypothetical protein